jgi:hypothetical protein
MFDKYSLPFEVQNGDKRLLIRSKCDFRVVLDTIQALQDNALTDEEKAQCALIIFYENYEEIQDPQEALNDMMKIISYEEDLEKDKGVQKPQLMDWHKDFNQVVQPINRIIGYDVRLPNQYTHWWSFIGAYMEIGECTFSTIVSIRSKKAKHQKLEKWEEEFCREHPELIALPQNFTQEEEEFFSLFEKKGE